MLTEQDLYDAVVESLYCANEQHITWQRVPDHVKKIFMEYIRDVEVFDTHYQTWRLLKFQPGRCRCCKQRILRAERVEEMLPDNCYRIRGCKPAELFKDGQKMDIGVD